MQNLENRINFTGNLVANDQLKKRIMDDSVYNQYGIYHNLNAIDKFDDGKVYTYEEKKMMSNHDCNISFDTIAMIKNEDGDRIISKVVSSYNELNNNYDAPKSFISDMISEFAKKQYGINSQIDSTIVQKNIFDLMV